MNQITILLLAIFSTISSTTSSAQGTKKTDANSGKSEIDVLYAKYKTAETITLYNPLGDLNAEVETDMNDKKQPTYVKIGGETTLKESLIDFITTTITMKMKQGYKMDSRYCDGGLSLKSCISSFVYSNLEANSYIYSSENAKADFEYARSINHLEQTILLKKGSMYFTFTLDVCILNTLITVFDVDMREDKKVSVPYVDKDKIKWSIETGDSKRKGGQNATEFKF